MADARLRGQLDGCQVSVPQAPEKVEGGVVAHICPHRRPRPCPRLDDVIARRQDLVAGIAVHHAVEVT